MYFDDLDDGFSQDDSFDQQPKKSAVKYISMDDVPYIPESIEKEDFRMLLPKGFEEEVQILLDGNTIILRCLKPENPEYTDVLIRPALYNSKGADTVVPRFLFETSTVSKAPVEYFGKDKNQIFTINMFLYKLIADRLAYFKQFNQQFVYLLQQDVTNLSKYIEYVKPEAYNAQQKAKNTFVIISASAHREIFPWGNFMGNCKPSEDNWAPILTDLSPYIRPSSDSSMHKQAKVVLSEKPVYRSVGYVPSKTGDYFYSLFESKQNIPARLKTHYLGDAKRILTPDLSVFQQDCLAERDSDGQVILKPKDATLKKAIVVFAPIEWNTKRFIAGEAEVSANIADTLVVNTDSVNVGFTSKEGLRIKHDIDVVKHVRKDEEVLLGYDDELEPVTLPRGTLSYKITKMSQSSSAGLTKLHFEAVMKAGNARITSNTGLKFVSKVMTDLGKIYMPKPATEEIKPRFSPVVQQYLKTVDEDKLAKYKKVDHGQFDPATTLSIDPDVIVGMNAVKANSKEQCNSIALAQATLAVELGYYIPSEKFGLKGLLNSEDEAEINRACESLPEFVYIDRYGKKQKVLIGMAYLNFTELGSVYTRFKPQSFAFTSGKNIFQNCPELAEHIYANYLEQDKVSIALEFYKILNDPKGALRKDDRLPRYTPRTIRQKKIFTQDDLILRKTSVDNGEQSKLLDEDWNKGFYIDLTEYQGGMLIRIPSAKTLKEFVGKLPEGLFSFHGLIVNVSTMIKHIIGTPENNYSMSLGYLYSKGNAVSKSANGRVRLKTYDLYMKSIQGALYSNEDSAMMIIQSLIKPKINGLGMKQVVEPLLPNDVIVITDDRKYLRLREQCFTEEEIQSHSLDLDELLNEDYDKDVDNILNLVTDNNMSNEEVEKILNDVPLVLAIRDPSLWEMQLQKARVWSRKHLALHLQRCEQPVDLDEYLSRKHNRDICLVSSFIALASKSDCDGDRLPLFVLNREGQVLLRKFTLNNVLQDELNWINNYIRKEFSSTDKLHIDNPEKHKYKLFKINSKFDVDGDPKNYPQYLFNAQIAKGNIGPATIDMWALYMVIECYMAYCQEHNFTNVRKGKKLGKLTQVITEYDKKYLSFKQTELVQGNVIEAVKHMEGGSSAFKKYFLDGMTDPKNIDVVRKEFITPYKDGGYGMTTEDANRMLYVVKWAKDSGMLKAVKNFITKYNKGKLPADPTELNEWETFIQKNTYFGGLIQPIFDIKVRIEELHKEAKAEAERRRLERSQKSLFGDAGGFDDLPDA